MKHIDVSTELLLSLCRDGAQVIVEGKTYECTHGISPHARIASVSAHPVTSSLIRIEYIDPDGEALIVPYWRTIEPADAYHQPDRTLQPRMCIVCNRRVLLTSHKQQRGICSICTAFDGDSESQSYTSEEYAQL